MHAMEEGLQPERRKKKKGSISTKGHTRRLLFSNLMTFTITTVIFHLFTSPAPGNEGVLLFRRPTRFANDLLSHVGNIKFSFPLWAMDWSIVRDIFGRRELRVVNPDSVKINPTAAQKEDLYAYENFFYGKSNGTFLELGAQNTKWLGDELGYKGIILDAFPSKYEELLKSRPDQIVAHAAICDTVRQVHVVEHDSTGGIWEAFNLNFQKKFHQSLVNDPKLVDKLPVVSCLPLSLILDRLGVSHINFFSLQLEGAELSVLSTIDFQSSTFDVIMVLDGRDAEKEQKIVNLLESHGYVYKGKEGQNDWFVNKDFKPSFKKQTP